MKRKTAWGQAAALAVALTASLTWATLAGAQDKGRPDASSARAETTTTAALTPPEEKRLGHPFAALAGSWAGNGTITMTGGGTEKLRCRATYTSGAGSSLALNIRCASDSFKVELTSNVSENQGQITGTWSEASFGVSGSINGQASSNRISAVAEAGGVTANISVATTGNRQAVTITPTGVAVSGVQIALNRR